MSNVSEHKQKNHKISRNGALAIAMAFENFFAPFIFSRDLWHQISPMICKHHTSKPNQKTNQNIHSASVPHFWNQLNVTIFSDFQMFDTNWIVNVLISSSYLIQIEEYHIHTVSDVWYQWNGISFNQFQISNSNWRVPYLLNLGFLFSIEWCHIKQFPCIA